MLKIDKLNRVKEYLYSKTDTAERIRKLGWNASEEFFNGVKLYDFASRLVGVFGKNASIALCYLLATLFRDIIFKRTRHFPILNLFGEKGTGKTTLATSLQSFYLNMTAVASLFNNRNMNATANRFNWSTIMSYLKSHSSFLGLKQDRFTILLPSGLPDYSFEMVNNEQVKKVKVNRPKALCFDYLQLKEAFGLDLETEMISDALENELL